MTTTIAGNSWAIRAALEKHKGLLGVAQRLQTACTKQQFDASYPSVVWGKIFLRITPEIDALLRQFAEQVGRLPEHPTILTYRDGELHPAVVQAVADQLWKTGRIMLVRQYWVEEFNDPEMGGNGWREEAIPPKLD